MLADFGRPEPAHRLAARLVIEGVGAEVWPADHAAPLLPGSQPPLGPTVVVRRADHMRALVLAHAFAEVDAGSSRLAPPPRDFWHGEPHRQLAGYGVLLLLLVAVATVAIAAATI